MIQSLNLAIYTPSDFILASRKDKYEDSTEGSRHGLTMSGRERGIRRLMCINMLKRLESSVNSFRLTTSRVRQMIASTLGKIDNLKIEDSLIDDYSLPDDCYDSDDMDNDVFIGSRKGQIRLQDMDYVSWKQYLEKDIETLDLLMLMLSDITPEHDSKLQQLKADLRYKFEHPINGDNRKVIIFTAFSDTALYLYENIANPIKEQFGLNTALITGDIEARSTLKMRQKQDFNTILTLFSPVSKEKETIFPGLSEEIDVLIATDCISEGQNLQDCDCLINFDIHWNPVRIIQRFGRIDRIGSRNKAIQLINYWPDMTLDEYIDLKGRVEARMKVSVLTATGDDNPLTTDEQNDLDYRKEQLSRLKNEVIDLEEMNTGVSIMDLGLNEFRLDLLSYMKDCPDVEHTPYGLHAVVEAKNDTPEGVIFVLKSRKDAVPLDARNRLHPFYLVYITPEKAVIVNHLSPKEMLDRYRLLCKGLCTPDKELCKEFNKETRDGLKMDFYSDLLNAAVDSIVHVKDESDIDSFLSGEQLPLFSGALNGLEDFLLIDFLVIRKRRKQC